MISSLQLKTGWQIEIKNETENLSSIGNASHCQRQILV
jgi:hypothetical protein